MLSAAMSMFWIAAHMSGTGVIASERAATTITVGKTNQDIQFLRPGEKCLCEKGDARAEAVAFVGRRRVKKRRKARFCFPTEEDECRIGAGKALRGRERQTFPFWSPMRQRKKTQWPDEDLGRYFTVPLGPS